MVPIQPRRWQADVIIAQSAPEPFPWRLVKKLYQIKSKVSDLDPNGSLGRSSRLMKNCAPTPLTKNMHKQAGKLLLETSKFAEKWAPEWPLLSSIQIVPRNPRGEYKYGGSISLEFLYKVIIQGVRNGSTFIIGQRNCSINLRTF